MNVILVKALRRAARDCHAVRETALITARQLELYNVAGNTLLFLADRYEEAEREAIDEIKNLT